MCVAASAICDLNRSCWSILTPSPTPLLTPAQPGYLRRNATDEKEAQQKIMRVRFLFHSSRVGDQSTRKKICTSPIPDPADTDLSRVYGGDLVPQEGL